MAADGRLMFETGIDNSGFSNGVNNLQAAANVAMGNIAANMVNQMSSAAAQIPQQMINVGSGFEASMSQVAATMGITSAAAEFQTLSAAAKEMGESTKFSASQAGEALNYLALAGYDANKAVAALPTVLNVAAAGGMELAAASDMITDAMSALGLETSQMADFSDKLAVTAQKSNTSVSQLGEAILTVGGTAKMLSGGVTEMNTALGILADNGIKGSEGGTALRNVILSLSAPTDTAAAALESLGVTAFDASGAMRPLEDTFADLNTALSSLSDQDRTAVLNEIFNKVDLKSVNALLGTSSERFDELSGYISDCAGAAAQMAQTMDDNLKGDLTIMQSALEGLGIAAYEKFQTPMRSAVQDVTACVGDLTESFSSGELSESFDTIASAMNDAASSIMEILSNDIIPAAVTGFSTIIEYGDEIIAMIGGIAAAVAVVKITPIISNTVSAILSANKALNLLAAETSAAAFQQTALASGMSMTEIAVGLLTGKLNIATAAEALLGVEINKTTVAAIASKAALAGLAAVAIAGALAFKNYVDDMETAAQSDPWTEKYDEQTRAIREQQSALEELSAAREEANKSDNAEIDNIQRLWSELQNYVDETGNVIAENERAAQIIELLNNNYDTNIDFINGQIQGYQDLSTSMDDYIANLRLESQIRNGQDTYDEAVANYQEYVKKREALLDELDLKEKAFTKAREDGNTEVAMVFGEQANSLKLAIEALDEIISEYSEEMFEYESLFSQQMSQGGGTNPLINFVSSQMSHASALYTEGMQTVATAQENATSALETAWKQLEHNYATGVIATEAELYRQKAALLDQYGNADLEDHWKYYEDLYAYQKESAENSIRLAEEAAREEADIRDREWNNIAHKQSLGLLSAEDAYREQLAFIKKYCPEYSDEWYNYYQTILEYQRDAQQKQVNSVKDGISELVAEYKSAYKELESERNSYKNRLMSVGSLFSVDTETDENGNTTKIVSVENMRKQMAEMQKYHDYVTKLKAQGASRELIGELTSMDFEDGSFTAKNLANMSESEFKEINDLYKQKEELADKLSNELFEPEMNELNEGLVNGVLEKFGTLPTEIQEIGAESLAAFIAGLTDGDLSEQVDEFAEKFASDCAEGIQNSFADAELDYAALINADTYSIGKNAGDEYVEGFNEALAQLQAAIAAEQDFAATSTAPKRYSETEPQASAGTSAGGGASAERIVIQNHIELDVDGEKLAEKTTEKQEIINYRKGV